MKRYRGLSLIEVLVTITITSIGLMGLVSLQMQAVKATTDSGNRSQAVWVFNDIINRIHANEVASADYITGGFYACGAVPTICSSYNTGTGAQQAVAECSGAEMAAWDLFEVACGSPKNDAANGSVRYIGNSINYLPNARLQIACAGGGVCLDGAPLAITLQWRAKAEQGAITGAARSANSGLLTLTDVVTP
jgi:type IV pilus assembly protein PilV